MCPGIPYRTAAGEIVRDTIDVEEAEEPAEQGFCDEQPDQRADEGRNLGVDEAAQRCTESTRDRGGDQDSVPAGSSHIAELERHVEEAEPDDGDRRDHHQCGRDERDAGRDRCEQFADRKKPRRGVVRNEG